jgi:DNA helicase-2/ATP-dependent DNA helicase PcrA
MTDEAAGRQAYLAELNESQLEAVQALDGPVLLLAGAGTGKTRALTTRLAHILATGRVASPGQILAVTFTNKAAREMKNRVAALLGRDSVEGWWLGTFHSQAARILRERAERVGLRRDFTILDRRPTAPAQAASCGREHRRQKVAGAESYGGHPALEGPRPDAG